jgi:hypothetical protein
MRCSTDDDGKKRNETAWEGLFSNRLDQGYVLDDVLRARNPWIVMLMTCKYRRYIKDACVLFM